MAFGGLTYTRLNAEHREAARVERQQREELEARLRTWFRGALPRYADGNFTTISCVADFDYINDGIAVRVTDGTRVTSHLFPQSPTASSPPTTQIGETVQAIFRSEYVNFFLQRISRPIRLALADMADNWDGIHSLSAALDCYERAAIDGRFAGHSTALFRTVERHAPSLDMAALRAAHEALERAPENPMQRRIREQQRAYEVAMSQRQYHGNQMAGAYRATSQAMRGIGGAGTTYTSLIAQIEQDEAYMRTIMRERVGQSDEQRRAANDRGLALLKENLTPTQLASYEANRYFEVTGGTTRKRYLIRQGTQQNVYELDNDGHEMRGLCFMPRGGLCVGDTMLAQKAALELNEREALNKAIPFGVARISTTTVNGPIVTTLGSATISLSVGASMTRANCDIGVRLTEDAPTRTRVAEAIVESGGFAMFTGFMAAYGIIVGLSYLAKAAGGH